MANCNGKYRLIATFSTILGGFLIFLYFCSVFFITCHGDNNIMFKTVVGICRSLASFKFARRTCLGYSQYILPLSGINL